MTILDTVTMSKVIDSLEVSFHDENSYQNTVYCSNYGANVSNNPDDFVFDTNHSNKNLNDGTCFRVVGSTVYKICLTGKIEIPEFEDEYLKTSPHATLIVDNDYDLSDYNVKIYHHSGNLNEIYRKYMLKTFGISYALDFLFNLLG